MFVEGTEVKYKDLCGIISFICDDYSVLKLPSVGKRESAKLLIFKEYYSQVIVLKDSER